MITQEQIETIVPRELQGFAADYMHALDSREILEANFRPIQERQGRAMAQANAECDEKRLQIADWGERHHKIGLVTWVFETINRIRIAR